jgi:hypothetical protein
MSTYSIRAVRIAALALALWVTPGAGQAPSRITPLIGTWRFVRYVVWDSAGSPQELLGPHPVGYVVFDATGRAFIQLMRADDRTSLGAYFGRYTVNAAARTVNIRVEGSNIPDYIGTVQVRPYRLRGDTLVLGVVKDYQATLVRVR